MIQNALEGFAPASAELLARRALLRRSDTKFVVRLELVTAILPTLRDRYVVVGGGEGAPYSTLYLDTDDLRCFHDHRRGRRLRHKIRIRHYRDRELTYLEVKSRINDVLSTKQRLALPYGTEDLDEAGHALIEAHAGIPAELLLPQVVIDYHRITLLSLDDDERLTIDLALTGAAPDARQVSGAPYRDPAEHVAPPLDLRGVVFIEVKQGRRDRTTAMVRALHAHGARPVSISKYCAAIAAVRPDTRHNRLMPTLRRLRKVAA